MHFKNANQYKKLLTIVSFVVVLVGLIIGANAYAQWRDFKTFKTVSAELNTTLGGGFSTTNTWYCGLESTNCPSVRMLKNANFADNDAAKRVVEGFKTKLVAAGYGEVGIGVCEADQYFKVYCGLSAKKNGLKVVLNAKQDFIGIDIAK